MIGSKRSFAYAPQGQLVSVEIRDSYNRNFMTKATYGKRKSSAVARLPLVLGSYKLSHISIRDATARDFFLKKSDLLDAYFLIRVVTTNMTSFTPS